MKTAANNPSNAYRSELVLQQPNEQPVKAVKNQFDKCSCGSVNATDGYKFILNVEKNGDYDNCPPEMT